MKKIAAILLVLFVLASAPVSLSIQIPRQVDPSTAPADPVYGQGLYLFYGILATSLVSGNFSAASHLLKQSVFIHIPPDIADAIGRFNELFNSTAQSFTAIDHHLKNASAYISTGRLEQAKPALEGAFADLRSVNGTLTQLFEASPQLAALTGIPPSLLLQKLQPLSSSYSSYLAEAQHLLKLVTGAEVLDHPSLTLSVTPRATRVGSKMLVEGRLLNAEGSPITSRLVTIYFAGLSVGQVHTDYSGYYSGFVKTPFFYDKAVEMFASFLPTGNDTLVFAPATSIPVELEVGYDTPDVSFSIPKSVYAGQPLHVSGTLSFAQKALPGYTVSLSAFKQAVYARSQANGSFFLDFPVPSYAGQGTFSLLLQTGGNGTIGPITISSGVFVVRLDALVSTNLPPVILAGFPVTISGSVNANGSGVAGARILSLGGSPTVDSTTTRDGRFSFSITAPLTTPNGAWTAVVGVYPAQSWISTTHLDFNVFVINPIALAFPGASVVLIFIVVMRRRPKSTVAIQAPLQAAPPEPAQPRTPPTGLALIYAEAVQLVQASTSVILPPHATIREYLEAVRGKLIPFEHFTRISFALEAELYGPGAPPDNETVARLELESLRRKLEA